MNCVSFLFNCCIFAQKIKICTNIVKVQLQFAFPLPYERKWRVLMSYVIRNKMKMERTYKQLHRINCHVLFHQQRQIGITLDADVNFVPQLQPNQFFPTLCVVWEPGRGGFSRPPPTQIICQAKYGRVINYFNNINSNIHLQHIERVTLDLTWRYQLPRLAGSNPNKYTSQATQKNIEKIEQQNNRFTSSNKQKCDTTPILYPSPSTLLSFYIPNLLYR